MITKQCECCINLQDQIRILQMNNDSLKAVIDGKNTIIAMARQIGEGLIHESTNASQSY